MADIRNFTDLADYAQQQIERIGRMQQDLAEQCGEGVSPRGLVRARTGPAGMLMELQIHPNARRLQSEDLAAEVMAAITAAQHEYAEKADEIMAPVLGARPSEQSVNDLEAGIDRLEALADSVERLARQQER